MLRYLTLILISLYIIVPQSSSAQTTIVAVADGNWVQPQTWNCNCRPQPSDNIRIPHGLRVFVTRPVMLSDTLDIRITVAGILEISNGSMHFDASDRITVLPGGSVVGARLGGMFFFGIDSINIESPSRIDGPATLGGIYQPYIKLASPIRDKEAGK